MSDLRVERQNYSAKPWRVLHADGEQVWVREKFDHPLLGPMMLDGPVGFDRKRDAVAWVEAHKSWTDVRGTQSPKGTQQ